MVRRKVKKTRKLAKAVGRGSVWGSCGGET